MLIRGYVDAVVISCGAEVIARHARSYEREDFVFDPLHYLALLEHKMGALGRREPHAVFGSPGRERKYRRGLAEVRSRCILPISSRLGEGRLNEPTAVVLDDANWPSRPQSGLRFAR